MPLRPQCFWAILLSQYRRRTGSGPCTRGRRLRPPKGDFVTKYLFQFARILAFCFLGEILHAVLPLPIPASIYGLVLMLALLMTGALKLDAVEDAGKFMIEIMPVMFIPAGVGLMESWGELKAVLVPVLVITLVSTIVVMIVSGRVTQAVIRLEKKHKGGDAK